MLIKLKPFDTLFFRNSRPFTKGEDTWTDFVFPPYPSTVYGAIRSYLIFKMGSLRDFIEGKFRDILGVPGEPAKFTIKGPFLMKEDKLVFKMPYDLVKLKDEDGKVFLLDFTEKPSLLVSDFPFDYGLLWKREENIDDAAGWMEELNFEDYLKGEKQEFGVEKDEIFYKIEDKVGISINKAKGTSEEGHLYRFSMVRLMEDTGMVIKIEGIEEFDDEGVLQLGGERKAVAFEKMVKNSFEDLENLALTLETDIFKIYLATPAIFKKGWLPDWIDEKTLEGEFKGIRVKLLTCAIGKYITIGGWDMAEGESKPLKKAVPAGSVYYFKILNEVDKEKVKETFHFKNISDEKAEEGFGLSIMGEVKRL
ncbi:CRISPR-associated protein Cmr3 [Thermoanaerobacter uzonensis DSM 18761]|uniref:CRISPR-associated protein Cmr3 n=1 Tax=Thermoanaerobacter uzonensis DSM 18761 TaxID=1123369 RepID=A0A1M5B6Q4_9THEO|nr:type III-B CRISPR module-associated protein Cmr3 [Thermoanaerobacter uzonensis]SHF38204.1 CRISPR-associated protein Cmr3 [Thermoanaerobacter uzonensis DSM 18761]